LAAQDSAVVHFGRPTPDKRAGLFLLGSLTLTALLGLYVLNAWQESQTDPAVLLGWAVAALVADLLVVRFPGGFTLSMSPAVTLAAAMVLAPVEACFVAFVGCLDPIELRGGSSLAYALFNRTQVAVATLAASLVFRAVGAEVHAWPALELIALLGLAADFAVNSALACFAVWAKKGTPPARFFRQLFGAAPMTGVLVYLSLGAYAPVVALAQAHAGPWGLAASVLPLSFGRLSLARADRLSRTQKDIERKDAAIREAVAMAAQERRDERRVLAGELHDEVLPALFKVHLMGQVIRRDLETGHLLQLDTDVPSLLDAVDAAQSALRGTVDGLRQAPLSPAGVEVALRSLAEHLETLGGPPCAASVEEVDVGERSLLIAYQVAREAMTNSAKHAQASRMSVKIWPEEEGIRVRVEDDGKGFDPQAVDTHTHFGIQLMGERVRAAGGRLLVDSRLGVGTIVTASIPPDG
jgi:signal transduction histidine kinase